jgi:hypothetical protein
MKTKQGTISNLQLMFSTFLVKTITKLWDKETKQETM